MSTTTPSPTPETDAIVSNDTGDSGVLAELIKICRKLERERDEAREHLALYREQCAAANKGAKINAHINHSLAAKLAEAKRERDEAREQIASCAINTNVRLFDLVRQMRAPLHEDDLITDEEYFWLCENCEMANSPEGGSPSPRRLEDYDVLSEKLQAMREAIKEAHALLKAMEAVVDAAKCIRHWHDAGTDGMIVSRWHVFKLWEALAALRENDQAQAAFAKLKTFITA